MKITSESFWANSQVVSGYLKKESKKFIPKKTEITECSLYEITQITISGATCLTRENPPGDGSTRLEPSNTGGI